MRGPGMPHVTISSTMAFNVAKIASARASLTISLTKSLRVAGLLMFAAGIVRLIQTHDRSTNENRVLIIREKLTIPYST